MSFHYLSYFLLIATLWICSGFGALDCKGLLLAQLTEDQILSATSRWIGTTVDMDEVKQHLRPLTGEVPIFWHYRLTDRHSEANREWTRRYIADYLQAQGFEVKVESFEQGVNFSVELRGTEKPNEVFEVTAHYDTYRENVPGADDNGSGLGALFAFAKIFRIHPPKKTLRFTFMDLEEKNGEGAEFHAKKLRREFFPDGKPNAEGKIFLGSLVIDTIGYNPSMRNSPYRVVLEVGEVGDYGERFGLTNVQAQSQSAYAMSLQCAASVCRQFTDFANSEGIRSGLQLTVETHTAEPNSGDHGGYWERNLPALLLAAPYTKKFVNPTMHTTRDQINQMNWDYYRKTLQFAAESVARIIEAEPKTADTPEARLALQQMADEINRTPATDPVAQLTTPRSTPSNFNTYQGSSALSVAFKDAKKLVQDNKIRMVLAFESNQKRGDLICEDGRDLFFSDKGELSQIVELAKKQMIPMIQKTFANYISYQEAKTIAEWLKLREDTETQSPALPSGFMWVEIYRDNKPKESDWLW